MTKPYTAPTVIDAAAAIVAANYIAGSSASTTACCSISLCLSYLVNSALSNLFHLPNCLEMCIYAHSRAPSGLWGYCGLFKYCLGISFIT
jgi:hypothetical protein